MTIKLNILYAFTLSTLLIGHNLCAALDTGSLNRQLKNNPHILSYKTFTPDKHTIQISGKLNDGSKLKIIFLTGKVISKTYVKIIPFFTEQPRVTDQEYWINQSLAFAKQIWRKTDLEMLQKKITRHEFSIRSKKNALELVKYGEGYVERITIMQFKQETNIEIQQYAD